MKSIHLAKAALCGVCLSLLGCRGPQFTEVPASPDRGFNWPYLIHAPADSDTSIRTPIVSPNGSPRPSDDLGPHRERAQREMETLMASLGKYHTAILIPLFPRPETIMGGWKVLTHTLDRDTMLAGRETLSWNAVRVHWSGRRLTEDDTLFYRPGDLFAVQDGVVFRCVATDFDWTRSFHDVSELEMTFVMREGWDFTRPFNFVESPTKGGGPGCLLFRDVRLDTDSANIENATDVRDPAFEITGLTVLRDGSEGNMWGATGASGPLDDRHLVERLDLQLLAMIEDARSRFELTGYDSRSILIGFSASGQFVNRFTLLHPDAVRIAIAGGCGGTMVPLAEKDGHALRFPLGTADYEEIAGWPFDVETYRAVDQFYYVGEKDTNDPVAYPDGYEDEDRVLVYELFGGESQNAVRFLNVQKTFEAVGCSATFKVYPNRGHEIGPETWDDIRAYLDERVLP
jgi:predicted esterase